MAEYPTGSEKDFNEFLVREYLKHGSVDEVLKKHTFDLPISYASYQRVLDKWGIIKAAGPNNKISETLDFISHFASQKIPVDQIYKKMPLSFRSSAATLYRILSYVKEGITRRLGTALVITIRGDNDSILVAEDITKKRFDILKYGSITIPMCYSKLTDLRHDAIKRVLQQEVFTDLAIKGSLSDKLIPDEAKPFVLIDMADIRVEVFHLELPSKYKDTSIYSSFKLKKYSFKNSNEILKKKDRTLRMGVHEAVEAYKKMIAFEKRGVVYNPPIIKAGENSDIAKGEI